MKKLLLIIFVFYLTVAPVLALDFDVSVDEAIKKKYDTQKLEYDVLPNLPKVQQSTSTTVPKTQPTYTQVPPVVITDVQDGIKIPSGTKFPVRSNLQISDWLKEGSTVSFTTTAPVSKNGVTIPTGTKLYGTVARSHQPQMTGNGGSVVIKLNSITYNNKNYTFDGKITKANSKNIFLNNIKGERKYWKNVANRVNKGEAFYAKSKQNSNKLHNNPVFFILSPIPTAVGAIGCTVCTLLSPITAITLKGDHISVPSGSNFEIKLIDSTYIK